MTDRVLLEAVGELFGEERKYHASELRRYYDQLKTEIDKAIAEISLKAGPQGDPGPAGGIGPDGKPGRDGDPGVGIESITKSSETTALVRLDNGKTFSVDLPVGPQGLEGPRGRGIKQLVQVADDHAMVTFDDGDVVRLNLPRGPAGEKGLDGDSVAVDEVVAELVEKHVEAIRGPAGPAGEPGADGLDAPIVETRPLKGVKSVDRGVLGTHRGGLFQTTKTAYGSPDEDPEAYRCIVRGVDQVTVKHDWSERKSVCYVTLSDGEKASFDIDMLPGFMPPVEGVKNITGDFYLEGKTLKLFQGSEWLEVDLQGPIGKDGVRGRKGAKGDAGLSGVGIEEIFFKDQRLIILLTNGETKDFLVDLVASREEIDQEIRRYAGVYEAGSAYSAGDVVTTLSGLFLALADTRQSPGDADWVMMLGRSGGGGGNGSAPSGDATPKVGYTSGTLISKPDWSAELVGSIWDNTNFPGVYLASAQGHWIRIDSLETHGAAGIVEPVTTINFNPNINDFLELDLIVDISGEDTKLAMMIQENNGGVAFPGVTQVYTLVKPEGGALTKEDKTLLDWDNTPGSANLSDQAFKTGTMVMIKVRVTMAPWCSITWVMSGINSADKYVEVSGSALFKTRFRTLKSFSLTTRAATAEAKVVSHALYR
jgi:hypothetical protein